MGKIQVGTSFIAQNSATDLDAGKGERDDVFITPANLTALKLTGTPMDALLTVGAEGSDTINVAINLKDANGVALAVRGSVNAYLSNDANGDSLCTTAPTGGCAIGTNGVMIANTPSLSNGLLVSGLLTIDSNAIKFRTTQTSAFLINSVSYTKAATTALVFSAAHVVTKNKFGVVLIQINAAGTVSTKVPGSPQAYTDAPTALAALPAADAGNVALGYIAIDALTLTDWTANTSDMTNASGVDTASFNNSSLATIGAAKSFRLTSESDGSIDVNVLDSGTPTFYLVLVLPNGKLKASSAITFA